MAEMGLVRFAQVALDVARATEPCYRTQFSKPEFTQPQLLAVSCLPRNQDWTVLLNGQTQTVVLRSWSLPAT